MFRRDFINPKQKVESIQKKRLTVLTIFFLYVKKIQLNKNEKITANWEKDLNKYKLIALI